MKKYITVEEAIQRGYNSKKVTQIAKAELGEMTTKRRIVARLQEAEAKVNSKRNG